MVKRSSRQFILPAEIKKRGVIMWQERFEEMQAMVDAFLIGYKEDFEVDKKPLWKRLMTLIYGCCAKQVRSLLI